jgi:photosystem II stability/assembly factor-like uncharacterized protein
MARHHFRLAALAALLLALLVAAAAPAARAQDGRLVWARVPGVPADTALHSVFMLDTSAAWAAGAGQDGRGVVYRLTLDGGRWRAELDATFPQPLYALVALDRQRLAVAGDDGLIARRDAAGGWTAEGPATPGLSLRALALFDDGRTGWAFGSRPDADSQSQAVALRYAAGRWAEATIERPGRGTFVNAVNFAPGAGWAVGSHIWRLDGGSWRAERSPDFCAPGCALSLNAVRALDAQRAWTVGTAVATCAICQSKGVIGARNAGGWMNTFPAAPAVESIEPKNSAYDSNSLNGLYFVGDEGLAVGFRTYLFRDGSYTADAFALRFTGGSWRYETILARTTAAPNAVFVADPTHALAVGSEGLVLSYGYGPQGDAPPAGNPAQPVPDPGQPGVAHFPETGHTLRGAFLRYWQQNGGLERFGYPLTEEFAEVNSEDGRTYSVQYFERARFEYHPELAGTPYEVLLGLLGNWVTAERRGEAPFQPAGPDGRPGGVYFPETGHTMAPEFVGYWQRNGGLPIYGYPISEPFYEVNAADGRSYLVQYFERNRFEYHPELADTRYEVLLGLLGDEYLRAKGWR